MASEFSKVQPAAHKAASARQELEAKIRAAHNAGHSLRAIAEAAGMSHESVRGIVNASDKAKGPS